MSAVQVRGFWRGSPTKTPLKGEEISLNYFRLLSDGQIQPLHYGAAICEGLTGHLKCICVDLSTQSLTTTKGINTWKERPPVKQESSTQRPGKPALHFLVPHPALECMKQLGRHIIRVQGSSGNRLTTALLSPSLRAGQGEQAQPAPSQLLALVLPKMQFLWFMWKWENMGWQNPLLLVKPLIWQLQHVWGCPMGAYLGEPLGAGDLYPHPSSAMALLWGPVCSLLPGLFFKLTLTICQDSFDCPKRPKHWRVIRTRTVQTEPHFKHKIIILEHTVN